MVNYKIIVSSRYNYAFDEYTRFSLLKFQEKLKDYKIYRDREAIADISPWDGYKICDGLGWGYPSVTNNLDYVRVEPGHIYVKRENDSLEEEKAYAHFQKRKFDILPLSDTDNYYVLSNIICNDKGYAGKKVIKRDNRKLRIRLIQLAKLFEILTSKYINRYGKNTSYNNGINDSI